jgi:hypothetical protein
MVSRKNILEKLEQLNARLLDRLRPWAYPAHGLTLPPILLFALPKSGSIYIQRALRRTLKVEVRHVGGSGIYGGWLSYTDLCRFSKGNVVSREHMNPRAELPGILADFDIHRAVVHVRDPRAAIVSFTRMMDRNLPKRGLRYIAFTCEQALPGEYLNWNFDQRLRWQIEHMMPRMVDWIDGWVNIADHSQNVKFLVTDFSELARDSQAFIEKLLKFYEVPYQRDWLRIPRREVGLNNIHSSTEPARRPSLSPEITALLNAGVPDHLIQRFGWSPPNT